MLTAGSACALNGKAVESSQPDIERPEGVWTTPLAQRGARSGFASLIRVPARCCSGSSSRKPGADRKGYGNDKAYRSSVVRRRGTADFGVI